MKVTLITFAAGDGITMGGDRGHIQTKQVLLTLRLSMVEKDSLLHEWAITEVDRVTSRPGQPGRQPNPKKSTTPKGGVEVRNCESSDHTKGCDGHVSTD